MKNEEIARMLGGKNFTSVTIKHAREMLGKASDGGRKNQPEFRD